MENGQLRLGQAEATDTRWFTTAISFVLFELVNHHKEIWHCHYCAIRILQVIVRTLLHGSLCLLESGPLGFAGLVHTDRYSRVKYRVLVLSIGEPVVLKLTLLRWAFNIEVLAYFHNRVVLFQLVLTSGCLSIYDLDRWLGLLDR